MTYGRIIQLESITKYQMSKQSIGHPRLFFLEGKLQSHYYKSIDYFLQHNWITRSQKEMGNRITLTQVNYVRKADETSSVAIMSQTPCFDPKWPWLFHQIRWKHYDIAPESASSSPSPIIHGSSFCTWKPTRALFPQADKLREKEGLEEVTVLYSLPSSFDAPRPPCDNELMLSAWTWSFRHACWCR